MADLNYQKVNCLHISDSIIFWTNSNTEADFIELVDVCYNFYWKSLQTTFPLRGCLTYGEIDFNPITIGNGKDVKFYSYSVIGKGLVDAYLKAESIEYVGCLLDKKAIEKVNNEHLIIKLIEDKKICMYKVPFKNGFRYEHVFRPMKTKLNDIAFRNYTNIIKRLFTNASKSDIDNLSENVKIKLNNTIDFINHFRETD